MLVVGLLKATFYGVRHEFDSMRYGGTLKVHKLKSLSLNMTPTSSRD